MPASRRVERIRMRAARSWGRVHANAALGQGKGITLFIDSGVARLAGDEKGLVGRGRGPAIDAEVMTVGATQQFGAKVAVVGAEQLDPSPSRAVQRLERGVL